MMLEKERPDFPSIISSHLYSSVLIEFFVNFLFLIRMNYIFLGFRTWK